MCSTSIAKRSGTRSTGWRRGSASRGGFRGFLDFILRFRRDLGIPHTLDRIGVDDGRLEEMAEMAAVDPTAGGNPRHLSPADALDLYRRALDGRLG